MSSDERYKEIIRKEMSKLKKPINLKVFTSRKRQPNGSFIRECQGCDATMSLLKIYEENSNGMLKIEEMSINDDVEFAKKYDVQRVPTILFIDDIGREVIRYLANPMGGEVQPFIQSIFAFAGAGNYYEASIKANLNRIEPATIKVMMTMACPYCPSVVSVANLFAIAGEGKLRSIIVDIMSNPDIGQYYDAAGVPYTIINDRQTLKGMVGPNEILRALIGSNIHIQH